jgi:hypothetical protein
MSEPTERDREMAEQLVIRWTTGRFADRMDDQDCEELQDAIAMKFATAREEGRREAIEALRSPTMCCQSTADGFIYRINTQGEWELVE